MEGCCCLPWTTQLRCRRVNERGGEPGCDFREVETHLPACRQAEPNLNPLTIFGEAAALMQAPHGNSACRDPGVMAKHNHWCLVDGTSCFSIFTYFCCTKESSPLLPSLPLQFAVRPDGRQSGCTEAVAFFLCTTISHGMRCCLSIERANDERVHQSGIFRVMMVALSGKQG